MNPEVAKKIADAVLYEGYMLYPYRPSAIKNRQRWSFGILYPPSYAEVRGGTERCGMHSECVLEASGADNATLQLELRFLHLLSRQVARPADGQVDDSQIESACFEPVPSLMVEGRRIESWDEGVERSVQLELALQSRKQIEFRFPASREREWLRDGSGRLAGIVSRTQKEVTGTVFVLPQKIGDGLLKLTVDVTNTTSIEHEPGLDHNVGDHDILDHEQGDRDCALLCSLLSAHTILTVNGGQFVSLLDPPEALLDEVSRCSNLGNFPVLVGVQPEREMLLCSPIILYDYPQIAPESAGEFCDATEMDEMLTLRVMTLTDEEKDEMQFADDRFRNLLQCTEQSARQQLARTHGTIRSLRPAGDKP